MSTFTKNNEAASERKARAGDFPRVLIVYMSCISKADYHGVSLRSWFHEWPSGKLAQIYSGNDFGREKFCGQTFKLGSTERRWGRIFFRLKGSFLGKAANSLILDHQSPTTLERLSRFALLRHRASTMLLESGIWELMFPPSLSRALVDWVNEFRPQLIYCQGYSLSFAWLPLMLKRHFKVPLCFQTGDDWPDSLYRGSIARRVMRPLVQRAIRDLVASAAIRFANGDSMAAEYKARYGRPFETIMMCDDLSRFKRAAPRRMTNDDAVSIVYTGALNNERWRSLVDLAKAVRLLKSEGVKVLITAFASVVPPQAVNPLTETGDLQILPTPAHEDVPAILKGADILFLPEAFDSVTARDNHLSISTKAHLYMMSERPVLVYGPPVAGVVDYARREKWAYVVDRQDNRLLAKALEELVSNKKLCAGLVETGQRVAQRNHDESIVRQRFLRGLQMAVGSSSEGE